MATSASTTELVALACDLQDAVLNDDVASAKRCLADVREVLRHLIFHVFAELSALPDAAAYVDPVLWATIAEPQNDRRFMVAGELASMHLVLLLPVETLM